MCGWAEALGLWVTVETCMLWNALVQSRCPVCLSSDWVESERKSLSSRCASHERTRPHLGPVSTHYPTQAVSSSWLYGQIESKFPNASEDAREEVWAPLSGLRLTADSRQVSTAYCSESALWLKYAAQAYNAKQSNILVHSRRVQGIWASGAGFWASTRQHLNSVRKL